MTTTSTSFVSSARSAVDGSVGTAPLLSFFRGVDRRKVHRSSITEVFVTDAAQVGEHRYVVAGQLPRGHAMVETETYDLNVLLELVRQAGVLVTHDFYGVPCEDWAFVFRRLDMRLIPAALRIDARPADAEVHIAAAPRCTRAGRITEVGFTDRLRLGGADAVTGVGALSVIPASTWRALRIRGRDKALAGTPAMALRRVPAPPSVVARVSPRNVVISTPVPAGDGRTVAHLVVDVSHAYLFDHELDHLPGNLLVEGARQAGLASVSSVHGVDPTSLVVHHCRAEFTDIGELDLPTSLDTRVGGWNRDEVSGELLCPVEVVLAQGGRVVTSVSLLLGVQG